MATETITVALLGANGQFGNAILHALLSCKEKNFNIVAFISPKADLKSNADVRKVKVVRMDLLTATVAEIAAALKGVEVVLSAVGGNILPRQLEIQDAAAEAGVRRFFPSEFGMHQVVQVPGMGGTSFVHPTWDIKITCAERTIRHPAVKAGKMTYTVIGCGELYDGPNETILCPWLDHRADSYVVQSVGNPDAKMDYISRHDIAAYTVAAVCRPEISENQFLGFRGDHITYNEVVELLQKYSKRPARLNLTSFENASKMIQDPSTIPAELKVGSSFPADFWILLRMVQGKGDFWRPPGLLSNDLFPDIKPLSFEEYFAHHFATTS